MFEWLKTILGDAYTEEIEKQIAQEIGKAFVAKKDFDAKNEELKQHKKTVADRDKQLDDLKGATGDVEALKKQIEDLQAQNKSEKEAHEAELTGIRINTAVEAALTKARAKNLTAVKALLAEFLSDAKLAEDGTVKGLQREIDDLVKGESTAFLFESSQPKQPDIVGMQPGSPGGNPPPAGAKKPEEMSYAELCAYLEANPGAKIT